MIYVFLAQGFEETEAIATIDILRRANLEVSTVGIGSEIVEGVHGIGVACDLTDLRATTDDDIDAIVLPGGMPGTSNLEESPTVQEFIDFAYRNNILICAICAAPSILGHKNILKDKHATCFPGYESDLYGAIISEDYVCQDGNIITGKGVGATMEFALKIVEYFEGPDTAKSIREKMQCPQSI